MNRFIPIPGVLWLPPSLLTTTKHFSRLEFPHPPYDVVPINGFDYPSVADLEEHVEDRRGLDRNLFRMWLPDQVWTQHRVELLRGGYAQDWPEWATSMIDNCHRPGKICPDLDV